MNTFYDFLNNRNSSYLSEQDFGQMPVQQPEPPKAALPPAGQPQQQQGAPSDSLWDDDYKKRIAQLRKTRDALPQQQQQIKSGDIYTVYNDLTKSVERAIGVVTNFVNAHPRKNEWYEGAKLMNIYDKIGKDIAASQELLKPLLQKQQ
jgi:hypothetical protein